MSGAKLYTLHIKTLFPFRETNKISNIIIGIILNAKILRNEAIGTLLIVTVDNSEKAFLL